jgi:hypothetical protein
METEPTEALPPDRTARHTPAFWAVVVAILLNIWYDYYHPLGIFFDVVIAVAWLTRHVNKS